MKHHWIVYVGGGLVAALGVGAARAINASNQPNVTTGLTGMSATNPVDLFNAARAMGPVATLESVVNPVSWDGSLTKGS